jgi:hypothetical protein
MDVMYVFQESDVHFEEHCGQTSASAFKRNLISARTSRWAKAGFMRWRVWKRLYQHRRITHIHNGSPSLKDSRPDEGMSSSATLLWAKR